MTTRALYNILQEASRGKLGELKMTNGTAYAKSPQNCSIPEGIYAFLTDDYKPVDFETVVGTINEHWDPVSFSIATRFTCVTQYCDQRGDKTVTIAHEDVKVEKQERVDAPFITHDDKRKFDVTVLEHTHGKFTFTEIYHNDLKSNDVIIQFTLPVTAYASFCDCSSYAFKSIVNRTIGSALTNIGVCYYHWVQSESAAIVIRAQPFKEAKNPIDALMIALKKILNDPTCLAPQLFIEENPNESSSNLSAMFVSKNSTYIRQAIAYYTGDVTKVFIVHGDLGRMAKADVQN